MNRTITAYFDSRTDAQLAADQLAGAGIARTDVSIHDASTTGTTATSTSEQKGFWASLGDLFMPDEDRHTYSEGIRRGGSMLTVRADEVEFDRVSDILESAGAVDLDTREAEWRSQGWSGYDAATVGTADYAERTGYTDTAAGAGATAYTGVQGIGSADRDMTGTGAYAKGNAAGREDYIPVAEEQLRVGKREVDHGRVRVRSYIRETPVEEHVRLRDETIDVDRRAVDRPADQADHLFQERVIEAEEHDEEAVVGKEARVVEEVRLRKGVEERDETIRDTVRRTDVDIEDERTGRTLSEEERRRRGY